MEEIWYTYSNGTKELAYEYEYTTYGQVYKRTDHLAGNATIYKYDERQRLVGVYEHSDDLEYSFNTVYSYDTLSQLIKKENYIDLGTRSISQSTEYTYDDDGKLLSENYGTGSLTYEYDPYNRLKKTVLYSSVPDDENSTVIESTYVYRTHFGNTTDGLISSYVSTVGDTSTVYTYEYDDRGYITKITVGDKEIRYTYDSLGQLIREDNELTNTTTIIDFWIGGNYTNKSVYELTDEPYSNLPYNPQVEAHGYDGDKLIYYNGNNVEFDALGNPLNSYAFTYTWNGRRLVGVTENYGNNVYSFTYNDDGIRTSKTKNGIKTTYYLDGSKILAEKTGENTTLYIYDSTGLPLGMQYHGAAYAEDVWDVYWFEKNIFGDIVAIYDENGTKLVSYLYDAWGDTKTYYHNGGNNTTAVNNPFTYRGYYYDKDLGFYYLNSRYYDPYTCRFISPDNIDVISATPTALTDKNLYSYCDNNPVMRRDDGGQFWDTLFDVVSLVFSVADVIANPSDGWAWAGLVGDIVDLVPFVSGVGEATDLVRVATKVDDFVDAVDNVHDTAKAVDHIGDGLDTSKTVSKTVKKHGNSLDYEGTNYGYALVDKDRNILKFGETIHPNTRYSKKYLRENEYSMIILDKGSKKEMHDWQHDMNMYFKNKYGKFPPLNKRGW